MRSSTIQPAPNSELKYFNSGTQNLLDDTLIASDAASDSKGWYTQDGRIKLVYGKAPVGAEGGVGKCYGEKFGYRADGTLVHFAKFGSKIKYFDGTAWQDIVTGLTATADYSFANYSSLAGTFTFAFGVDGIYKLCPACPASYIALYDSTKNFKGYGLIDKGRTIFWGRSQDKTGLYGSYIDAQNSTVYTTVTGEATTSLSGTLAFKGSHATANCFGVTITITAGGEVYTDNYNGVLTGSAGGTGTINYITGAYTLSNPGVGTANYQWENSNVKGVTDFTHSATRLAGEGFQFPQDFGGTPILNVKVGMDGNYYSAKSNCFYSLSIDSDDLGATNEVFRDDIGIQSWRAITNTQFGIVFMNTANPAKPQCTILQRNPVGGQVEPSVLFADFKFANYDWSDACFDVYERYIVMACMTAGGTVNDTILLGNPAPKTMSVDIAPYAARTFAKDNLGNLYMGSPISESIYNVFNGFDDNGDPIENYWTSKGENFQPRSKRYWPTTLKKHRKLRFRGLISAQQAYEVYCDYDDSGAQLVGTVRGDGSYVDYSGGQMVGQSMVGTVPVGGDSGVDAYPYFVELRIKKPPKFLKRKLTFKAIGIGYVDIAYQNDWGLMFFEDKIPARFRQKQNVSLDGKTSDLPTPDF